MGNIKAIRAERIANTTQLIGWIEKASHQYSSNGRVVAINHGSGCLMVEAGKVWLVELELTTPDGPMRQQYLADCHYLHELPLGNNMPLHWSQIDRDSVLDVGFQPSSLSYRVVRAEQVYASPKTL